MSARRASSVQQQRPLTSIVLEHCRLGTMQQLQRAKAGRRSYQQSSRTRPAAPSSVVPTVTPPLPTAQLTRESRSRRTWPRTRPTASSKVLCAKAQTFSRPVEGAHDGPPVSTLSCFFLFLIGVGEAVGR